MDISKRKELLFEFLRENGVYDEYMIAIVQSSIRANTNWIEKLDYLLSAKSPSSCFLSAFNWSDTSYNREVWEDLMTRWMNKFK